MPKEKTLRSEIVNYANTLPYWGKYLANIILSGKTISDDDIYTSYDYLLMSLGLKDSEEESALDIGYRYGNNDYVNDLYFTELTNVEGVNALAEKQKISFNNNLTILYGVNGSGKSGYVRLLKQAFFSKCPEDILPNIHEKNPIKEIKATFCFSSNGNTYYCEYPNEDSKAEFKQFSVFDSKGLISQLEKKNELVFRPAGLSFFSDYTDAVKKVESLLNEGIEEKRGNNEFIILFEEESEIKEFVNKLDKISTIKELERYIPFTEDEKTKKENMQKDVDELNLSIKSKLNEIKKYENLIETAKNIIDTIVKNNSLLSQSKQEMLNKDINNYNELMLQFETEGYKRFKSDEISDIGSKEWKKFIASADTFARLQNTEADTYPKENDVCLFCHQPLSKVATELIRNYWTYIRSKAEADLSRVKKKLDDEKK